MCKCSNVNIEWLYKSYDPKSIFYFNTNYCFGFNYNICNNNSEILCIDSILRFRYCKHLWLTKWNQHDTKEHSLFQDLKYLIK